MLFPLPSQPMDYFERMYSRRGYRQIAGVDEVGRGPLAGPVVAAAVVLPQDGIGTKLFDSKQISSKKREELYPLILTEASGVGIGIIGQEEIDRHNIFQATLKAMVLAIENLPFPPDFLLIDGTQGLRFSVPQKSI
ncbi:MAG TPA: ribonuclease HII, partial [Thermodesulfobacteriota bacterium]|nr:ribonuclease HII [Thermodesulfobacteriota bacterium]